MLMIMMLKNVEKNSNHKRRASYILSKLDFYEIHLEINSGAIPRLFKRATVLSEFMYLNEATQLNKQRGIIC